MTVAPNRHLLPAGSQAARAARVWVREAMAGIGRDDLIEAAELCISELVTNAVLHGQPPVDVRMIGTPDRPIIGVHDASVLAPKLTVTRDPSEADPLNTFGRGLSIVASYSSECGSSVDTDGKGKTVWFTPKLDPTPVAHPEVFDMGDLLADLEHHDWRDVELVNLPMAKFLVLSQRFEEFNRELQVLVHTSTEVDPRVHEFVKVVAIVREDLRIAIGNDVMWAAMASGESQGSFRLGVAQSLANDAERLLELMDVLLHTVGPHTMLSAPFSDEDLRLQKWYFGQFISQIRGGLPVPWIDAPAAGTDTIDGMASAG